MNIRGSLLVVAALAVPTWDCTRQGFAVNDGKPPARDAERCVSPGELCECTKPCDTPPPATCSASCQSSSYDKIGICTAGECVYRNVPVNCPYGCDQQSGTCRTGATVCQGLVCGSNHSCGGACGNSGCCAPSTYSLSTGFTATGASICCKPGDKLLSTIDCGDGSNHWVTTSGSCGFAYEGPGNYGGPCVTVKCESKNCS